jgi:hypothetical protein
MAKDHFPKVREARERLIAQADSLIAKYWDLINAAEEAGQFDVAMKHIQWLIEHTADDDGKRIVNPSVDNEGGGRNNKGGPVINLGFAIGGIPGPKLLDTAPIDTRVIDVKDENDPTSNSD